ncbi:MAG: N-acetyltransferase family protein [Chloroflexota bacterium]
MQISIRPVTQADVPFLWEMLFHAGQLAKEGATSSEAAKNNPHVRKYAEGWGKQGDLGVIAFDMQSSNNIGAAWLRLFAGDLSHYGYHDDKTPELAIAVQPEWAGKGIGSTLLSALIEQVEHEVPAIVLTVRNENPAKKLYEKFGFQVIGEVINRVGTTSSKMLLRFDK